MKKSLIAIAAIAAVGAASAQVTVYGKLDAGVTNNASSTKFGMNVWETSRLGVKASEKAGDLTLSVNLEGKLYDGGANANNETDGQVGFKGFDRTATVGVSGAFGTVTIGNQWTPFDNAVWATDALEYNGFTPLAGGMWNTDIGNTGMGNAKSSFQYATPDISGFQAFILAAPNVTGNTQGSTNYSGIGINYAKGPLVINFATQTQSGSFTPAVGGAAATQNATATQNSNVFAINYNLGVATLYGGVVNSDNGVNGNANSRESGMTVGAKMPLGADSVSIGFAQNRTTRPGLVDTTVGAWGAQYIKSLSKAAVAYVGIQGVDSVNKTGLGIRYNF